VTEIILVHSPLVGPSSLRPTAQVLEQYGWKCQVAEPSGTNTSFPAWAEWPNRLLESLTTANNVIVIGHSAGSLLAAWLAGRLNANGIICLDAVIPPNNGRTVPAEPWFYDFVHSLPQDGGLLPIWTDWWDRDLFEGAPVDEMFKMLFTSELPRIHIDWFDDEFEMTDWSNCARGYILTSSIFDEQATRAKSEGWPVRVIEGTHLHPALAPEETASAIVDVCSLLEKGL